ncbi:MAG: sugar phosphate isomerase/epimerase [Verrucomicrobia bacterium]|nr:sugar phosphate isomerase/epimerase [Verrucomicrobiota bacterium]MDA1065856.1 sugar phosphate isomerase/epimerase [Verrucomicrobiota bacterium]
MAKLSVITDGISRDFEHALRVLTEFGLEYAELQFLWDKEVGDLDAGERQRALALLKDHGLKVSCISRHIFGGMPVMPTQVGDALHTKHMDSFKRCIEMAHQFGCGVVRTMSGSKEMILFGTNGAEKWNVSNGAWEKILELLEPAVRLAEAEGITMVVETGNNAMITSAWLGRRMIEELGSKHLKILWDPANSLYCNEQAWPDGYEALKGGYLGHLHIKDVIVDIPKATVQVCELGTGQLGPQLEPIAKALKADAYDGVISLESVYHPDGGTYEDGFRASIARFKELFG